MKYIDNWVFHFNSVNNQWRAANREHYRELFNDVNSDNVLRSTNIDTLVEIINRTNGKLEEINNLVSDDNTRRS